MQRNEFPDSLARDRLIARGTLGDASLGRNDQAMDCRVHVAKQRRSRQSDLTRQAAAPALLRRHIQTILAAAPGLCDPASGASAPAPAEDFLSARTYCLRYASG